MRITIPVGVQPRTDADLSDITAAVRTGDARWVDETTLELPFESEPTAAEQEKVRRRLLTGSDLEEGRVAQLITARDALKADSSPVATAVRLLIEERLGVLGQTNAAAIRNAAAAATRADGSR